MAKISKILGDGTESVAQVTEKINRLIALCNSGTQLDKYVFLVESSQISTAVQTDLTLPGVPLSKVVVVDSVTKELLFKFTPPDLPEFKNANEIWLIDSDLFIVYYWNQNTPAQTSRLLVMRDIVVDRENETILYSTMENISLGVRSIHGSTFDSSFLYLSSRQESKLVKIPLKTSITDFLVYTVPTSVIRFGCDTIKTYKEHLYISTYHVTGSGGSTRAALNRVKTNNIADSVQQVYTFSGLPTGNVPRMFTFYKDHLFLFQQTNTNADVKVLKISLDTIPGTLVATLDITMPTQGDIHSDVQHNNLWYVTTGRNPILLVIDLDDMSLKSSTIITEAQVEDPVPNGFYGSPETGYITDDIVAIGNYLFLPTEVAKQGVAIVDINDLSNRQFIELDFDPYGACIQTRTY